MKLSEGRELILDAQHRYFLDGVRVPLSVTGVLNAVGISDVSSIPSEILERARIRGTAVHRATELIESGRRVDWDSVPSWVYPYLEAHDAFLNSFKPQWEYVEQLLLVESGGMMAGGMLDRAGWINGEPFIVDYKTSEAAQAFWKYQLAAYVSGAPKLKGQTKPYNMMSVQLLPSGEYKAHPYMSYHRNITVFRSALHVAASRVADGTLQIAA